ncbi:MAG: hypothetical protein Q4F98_06775 [Lachnospiraceae bacterium]|nr:hypothetical protein [Lachnospiraceae bacterium]
MKKKKAGIVIGLVLVFGIGASVILSNNAKESNSADLSKFGAALQKEYKQTGQNSAKKVKAKEELYAQGKNSRITVTDMEKGIAYYEGKGMKEEEAKKEAYKYAKENAALYTEAIKAGCEVTDKEVADYVNEMRTAYEEKQMDEESLKEFKEIIGQFDSADDYWEYEKTVYEKQLPMIKYTKQLEKEYYDKHDNAKEADWDEYFTNYKKEIVEKEQFVVVK